MGTNCSNNWRRVGKPQINKLCAKEIFNQRFGGICMAIQLKEQLGLTSFTIYEKENEVGGTWLVNTYPGCACDVTSHVYSFSFALNPSMSFIIIR
jgi:hypothetical protein